ncbi:MAG: hypothetical protein ACOCYE_02990 [Pseudomonadota bacterium]
MQTGLERLLQQTDDPFVIMLILLVIGLVGVCGSLFRAWNAEIKAHRQTIQESIQWTRQNTALISEVRQTTERFALLITQLAHHQRQGRDR